ncbi:hypothetical protein [Spongiactinospora sp. 9N601]|uniref:hypothetical protein n=1 Tax=Spongiactinospora sp. 9N601 TaxID=3375149 RepID=UPI003790704F
MAAGTASPTRASATAISCSGSQLTFFNPGSRDTPPATAAVRPYPPINDCSPAHPGRRSTAWFLCRAGSAESLPVPPPEIGVLYLALPGRPDQRRHAGRVRRGRVLPRLVR